MVVARPGAAATSRLTRNVTMRNHKGNDEFVYAPKTLTVRPGTRVVWMNRSSQPHTVTATGQYPAFDSGTQKLVAPRHSWSHIFRRAGTYHYFCLLHPYMKGTIVVRP
jgi:plastocyanin